MFCHVCHRYLPNIAHFILNTEPFKTQLPIEGIALGNACWGGNATNVQCNGQVLHITLWSMRRV